jgi:hypothetical protein
MLVGTMVSLSSVLQIRLMDVAGDGQTMAAELNQSAFNAPNTLGAWQWHSHFCQAWLVVNKLGRGNTGAAWHGNSQLDCSRCQKKNQGLLLTRCSFILNAGL